MPLLEGALIPDWQVDERVGALMSTRAGGVSQAPFASLNLGRAAGDDAAAVDENRQRFAASLGATPPLASAAAPGNAPEQRGGTRRLRLDYLYNLLSSASVPIFTH